MLPSTTNPAMPMGALAGKMPASAADILPPIAPPPGVAMPAPAGPGGTLAPGMPAGMPPIGAPAEPPYDIVKQADGSAVWMSKTDPPFAIGVVPPPKLPPALQPPKA